MKKKKNILTKMEKQSNREIDMEEVRKVFARFDANGDGKISPSELGDAVRAALGSTDMSDEEVQAMLKEMDADRDGFVDLGEFADFHRIRGKEEEEIKEAFDLYDENKNGLVSATELHMVLEKLGEKCTVKDCEKMIASVDSDGDGFVNFDEFKKMMGIGDGGGAAGNGDGGAA